MSQYPPYETSNTIFPIAGWYQVKDQLPETSHDVLTYNGKMNVGWYDRSCSIMDHWEESNSSHFIEGVTHWTKLPKEPYEN